MAPIVDYDIAKHQGIGVVFCVSQQSTVPDFAQPIRGAARKRPSRRSRAVWMSSLTVCT